MSEDRGVSEVLGYVLVISLVTVMIGVIMTTGFGALEASQEGEQINNMERGFDVLADNIEDLIDRDGPSRATELRISGGSLEYGTTSTVRVRHNGTLVDNLTIGTEPIVYDSGSGTQLVYESGAVIRSDEHGSVMLREPPFVFNNDTILVSGVRSRPMSGSPISIDDPGTVLIRGEYLATDTASTDLGVDGTLNISIETTRIDAWQRYFEDQDIGEVTTENGRVDLNISPSDIDEDAQIHVVRTRTRLVFSD